MSVELAAAAAPATNDDNAPLLTSTADTAAGSSTTPTLYDRIQTAAAALVSPPALLAKRSSLDKFDSVSLSWANLEMEVEIPVAKPGLLSRLIGKSKSGNAPPAAANDSKEAPNAEATANTEESKQSPTDPVPNAPLVKKKKILNGVTGCVKPGTLCAIMGASGAGKTTLLNILAGRQRNFSGELLLNGREFEEKLLKATAFVQQTDCFFTELTVREHLMFQAKLRLPRDMDMPERELLVDEVILEMGLSKCAQSKIGQVGRGGISGGERRRLSAATEILTNPSLIFLDEPLTGLDSSIAYEVLIQLKRLTESGRTVILSVHQPSSQLYKLFDQILYMAEGRTAYFGPLPGAIDHFAALGFHCPSWSNPPDYIIKLLSIVPHKPEESKEQVKRFLDAWDQSPKRLEIEQEVQEMKSKFHVEPTNEAEGKSKNPMRWFQGRSRREYHASLWEQISALLWRAGISASRDPMFFRARMFQTLTVALLVGLIYLQLGNGQRSVQDKLGSFYFILMNQAMTNAFGIQSAFPSEMEVVKREYAAGMYSSTAFFLMKNLAELPYQILFTFLNHVIVFWMVNFIDSGLVFIETYFIALLTAQASLSLGYLVATLAPSMHVAFMLVPTIMLPITTFGGLTLNVDSFPVYFYWLSYVSPMKYGYSAVNISLWKRIDSIVCDQEAGALCRFPDGQAVLDFYSWAQDSQAANIGALIALTIGIRLFAMYFLNRRIAKR